MVDTTINHTSTPPIYYEKEEKVEIRSINELYPEYTNCSVRDFKNNLRDVIYRFYNDIQKNIIQYSTDINVFSGVAMPKYYKNKNEIKILDHLYKFEYNFIYSITKEDDCIIAENEYFNIFGYGDTIEEAENELFEYINYLWESYVEDSDENLDQSAIELKEKLISNIRKIY